MRILKSHPILRMVNSYLIDSPQPSNLSYLWNFGSLLAFCLVIQIITGVTLAMHYNPNVLEAFNSVEHIMRDVNNGWLIRYLHSNTASAFFFLVYLHIGRGLYYGSYKSPRTLTWVIGTIILIVMMATAFLGFLHSPKWYNLDLNLLFSNILLFINYISSYYTIAVFSFTLQTSLVLFYLIDFRLSSFCLMLLSFFIVLFMYILFISSDIMLFDVVYNVGDNNQIGTSVNLEGHVHMNDENSSKSWALTGAMVGVGGVVGKAVARAPIPPLAKAGLVIGGAIVGGVGQKAIDSWDGNVGGSSTSSVTNSTISKLIADSQASLLQNTLLQLEVLYLIVLYMVLLIVILLIFKLYFKDSVKLSLFNFLGNNINSKLEYYLNKIIALNKKVSIFWIWFGIIAVTYGISIFVRLNYLMRTKISDAIDAHISLNPIKDNLQLTNRSIEEVLSFLQWGNYICLTSLIYLFVIVLFRFHFNKEISTIYIWALVLILIITLAYSVYISSELYANLDDYVFTYNSLNK